MNHVCFKRWGCHDCNSPATFMWYETEHLFIAVSKVFLVNDRGVQRDCSMKIANPLVKATGIGFEGWIVEPGETKCNMWQFWIKDMNDVLGRPCGASASYYRPPGTTKRRKPGEWYPAPWVPKKAIEDCISKFVGK
jgi:hypothetical protein